MYTHIVVHLISRTFPPCKTETLYALNTNSSLPLALGNHIPVSVLVNLTTIGTSYSWNHVVFVFFVTCFFLSFFLKRFYLLIFREREREGEREGEKDQCVRESSVASHMPLIGEPSWQPRRVP